MKRIIGTLALARASPAWVKVRRVFRNRTMKRAAGRGDPASAKHSKLRLLGQRGTAPASSLWSSGIS